MAILAGCHNGVPTVVNVKPGMTGQEVRTSLGEPALGDNPKDPNPNPVWQYRDAAAPVSMLMVTIQGDKVSKVAVNPNMAYVSP